MRAGIYARIRYEDALDLPMQAEALESFVRLKGWDPVLRETELDPKSSGRLPARDRLLAAAKAGKLDVIVAWKVDRFARSLAEFTRLVETLHAHGVGFASLADDFDLSGEQGLQLRRVLRVLASFQRQSQRDQARLSVQRARKAGQTIGRPPTARARLQEIRALAADGLTRKEIAERLGIHPRSVGRLLSEDGKSREI